MPSSDYTTHRHHHSDRDEIPKWQIDSEVTHCTVCNTHFNILNRRHHCRKCGKIVCGTCSDNHITYLLNTPIINQFNFYQPNRTPNQVYRTCDNCVVEINMIKQVLENRPCPNSSPMMKGSSVNTFTHNLNSSSVSIPSSDSNLCPVCANDLVKLYIIKHKTKYVGSIEEFERFKEGHINDCLHDFDFNTLHSTRFSPDANPKNKMLVYNVPPIPKPAFENINEISKEEQSIVRNDEVDVNDEECVICLEDLKPGDKVGRLECLCVFHYKCIKDWFNKKGYGECPVHFLHK